MSAEKPDVRVGQVWADCDKRMGNRQGTVVSVDETHARIKWGQFNHTRISIARMRPTSSGYRLVKDVPA